MKILDQNTKQEYIIYEKWTHPKNIQRSNVTQVRQPISLSNRYSVPPNHTQEDMKYDNEQINSNIQTAKTDEQNDSSPPKKSNDKQRKPLNQKGKTKRMK